MKKSGLLLGIDHQSDFGDPADVVEPPRTGSGLEAAVRMADFVRRHCDRIDKGNSALSEFFGVIATDGMNNEPPGSSAQLRKE